MNASQNFFLLTFLQKTALIIRIKILYAYFISSLSTFTKRVSTIKNDINSINHITFTLILLIRINIKRNVKTNMPTWSQKNNLFLFVPNKRVSFEKKTIINVNQKLQSFVSLIWPFLIYRHQHTLLSMPPFFQLDALTFFLPR